MVSGADSQSRSPKPIAGANGAKVCLGGDPALVWSFGSGKHFCQARPPSARPRAALTQDMKIHEYQAKDILVKHGVAVPRGEVANTLEEAIGVTKRLFAEGAKGVVVKAQIHAGGRGKGGGVKVA